MSAPPIPPAPMVDCHAHVWGPDMPFAPAAWTRPAYHYSVEQWQADMAANGITHGVIAAASLFGTYNDYVIRALRQHENLRGTAILDPSIGFYQLEDLRADGIVGVRLQWFMMDPLPDMHSAEFRLFIRRLRDFGMHVHLNIEGHRLEGVARVLADTGVKLVIDHYGWHDPAAGLAEPTWLAMLDLMGRGNVWIKLLSGFRRPDPALPAAYITQLLAEFGPERLLWGTDAPFVGHEGATTYAAEVAHLRRAVPDPDLRAALGRSGWQFYFGDQD